MSGSQLGDIWSDVSKAIDEGDARIRRELVRELDDVICAIEALSGHRFDLEEAIARYSRRRGRCLDPRQDRDAIAIHVVSTWVFVLTEGWGLVCRTIDWDDLPTWVQEWYDVANASDLAWLRRRSG
jgi:hypothetical protein